MHIAQLSNGIKGTPVPWLKCLFFLGPMYRALQGFYNVHSVPCHIALHSSITACLSGHPIGDSSDERPDALCRLSSELGQCRC